MASIVSGLGRLFNPASSHAPHTPRGQRQLESVTEEAHTYDLLFPENGAFQHIQHHAFPLRHGDPSSIAAAANSSDDRGGLNIQHPRDIRVIVGQYIGGNPRVLFDTQPPLLPPVNRSSLDIAATEQITEELRRYGNTQKSRTAPHTRHNSISQTAQSIFGVPGLPLSPVNESGGLFGNHRRPNTSDGETLQAQLAKEERQETDAMLSSMFGATGHRIVAGTKIHIKPYTPAEPEASRPLSPGTARTAPQTQRRRTPLTRSTTAEDLQNLMTTLGSISSAQRASRRQCSSIIVTKIFYVDSADEESRPIMEHSSASNDQQSRKFRTPAFAIAMVIYMPEHQPQVRMPLSARGSPALGQLSNLSQPETLRQLSSEEFDNNVEYVMAHWDMITRALSSLEIVVRCQISGALSQLDVDIPAPPLHGPNARPARTRAPPLPTLQLPAGALQQSSVVNKAAEMTSRRVVTALQIRGVAVGQGRWGVWREEARGVGKWAGGREQNFFLFNLLTAFLGNHTEWLDLMSSRLRKSRNTRNRDQMLQQQHDIVRHRTVVVSLDKMAARRLVFLLSSFLPTSRTSSKRHESSRSNASTSVPASSTSPLIGSPMSRRPSLRKTLSRSQLGQAWQSSKNDENAVADLDTATVASDDRTITQSTVLRRHDSNSQHKRKPSDAVSIRSGAVPITSTGPKFRKSSTTTSAIIHPEFAMPVAHFTNFLPETRSGASMTQRPSSSGSVASLALQRTLSRSESIDQTGTSADSQSTGRWFWSSRRGSSTETSETPTSSAEGLGILVPQDLRVRRPPDKLSRMVEDSTSVATSQDTLRAQGSRLKENVDTPNKMSSPGDVPHETDMLEPFPLDLSVNENDGVIDVALPPSDSQGSSFGSFTGSPGAQRATFGSFTDHLPPQSPTMSTAPTLLQQRRSHAISEVGGWLRRFHQDLVLQALQPYDTLKEEIKYAMRTEPLSSTLQKHDDNDIDEWTEVCTSVIADITTFTLTRLTLCRKHASSPHHQADALLGRSTKDNPDEEFLEESLIDHDATLTEAVERILSHSGQSSHLTSRGPSRGPSRPSSPPRLNPESGERNPALEIPKSECKKMVLGALEQVAKSVRDEMSTSSSSQGKGADTKERDEGEVKHSTLKEGVRRWFEEVNAVER